MRTSWLWWALLGTSLVQTTPIEAAAGRLPQNAACEGPSLTAFVVGQEGTILRSDDGFVTWISQQSGTTNALYGLSFLDAETGMVVGGAGTILRTTDGGQTWAGQDSGSTDDLHAAAKRGSGSKAGRPMS